jgi:Zn-dependent peptidase ImmA (M78 family)
MNSIRRASARAKIVHRELALGSAKELAHLVEICVARGAFVREEKLEGASARLVVQNRQGIISVAPTRHAGRRRFSIAHELGHFEMHRETQALWNCTDQDLTSFAEMAEDGSSSEESAEAPAGAPANDELNQEVVEIAAPVRMDPSLRRLAQEREANAFAAELLMPERFLRASIQRGQPRLKMIQELAREFEVSWLAMAYRFLEVVSEPCLLILRPSGNAPAQVLRAAAFRRAGRIEVLPRAAKAPERLSGWIRLDSGDERRLPDSLIQLDSELKAQTGTRVDLIWAPEFG